MVDKVATLTKTGGPSDDLLEHIVGWVLVVVFAMLVTSVGLI